MEPEKNEKKSLKTILYGSVYLLVFITAVVLLLIRGTDGMDPIWTLNIGVDLTCMVMGALVGIYTMADAQKTGRDLAYFRPMLHIVYIGLFTDLVAILLEGVSSMAVWNIIDNTVYYLCVPAGCYTFWRYAVSIISPEDQEGKTAGRIMMIGAVVYAAAILVNVFFGFFFKIDASGSFLYGPVYFLTVSYVAMTIYYTVRLIVANRKRMSIYQIIALATYMIAPLVAIILTRQNSELSIQYGVMMLDMLLMYCTFNIDEGREWAMADKDMQLAANIQRNVLPQTFPPFPERKEFELHASMDPAKSVGGDFYDFFMIDEDHLCMIIGDVSGKGVSASLFMMSARTILHSTAKTGQAPETILRISNAEVMSSNPEKMFVTVWLGILEIPTGLLRTASAGHEYPAVRQNGGSYEILKDRHGVAIGVMNGMIYPPNEIRLKPGDSIFVYTDGVPEASNQEHVQFGNERMIHTLNTEPDAAPEKTLSNMRRAVDNFVKNAEQFDDLTMLCLKYNGNKP